MFLAAFNSLLHAESAKEAFQKLENAIQTEIESRQQSGTSASDGVRFARGEARSWIRRLQRDTEEENTEALQNLANGLASQFHSEAVRAEIDKVMNLLQHEREARRQQAQDALEAVYRRAAETLLRAKDPAELDPLLAEINALIDDSIEKTLREGKTPVNTGLHSVMGFIMHWQGYLYRLKSGDFESARSALNCLPIPNGSGVAIMFPLQAEVRKRIEALSEKIAEINNVPRADSIRPIIDQTKTLEDIPSAISKLRRLKEEPQEKPISGDLVDGVIRALTELHTCYRWYHTGYGVTLRTVGSYPGNIAVDVFTLIHQLNMQLCKLMLPRCVGAPPETRAKPGEKIQEFLDRIILEAAERGDAALLARCRTAMKDLGRDPWDFGIRYSINGANMEIVGQYDSAVSSYHLALKSGGRYVARKFIEERLATLHAEQPAAYEEGTKRFLQTQ